MADVWARAALWLGLALVATLLSVRLRVATALSEIVVGTVAQVLIGAFIGKAHRADRHPDPSVGLCALRRPLAP